ncbi:hypothetical protein SAMD00019534_057720 [Acytostelium subglobosum LB1]|uniref:hypothetical protein n=1 Tax=Acytostelium subglobosum LB1 TaxID=1410327 RepID=UPI0006451349|nr:hypothetical protein SAMD00019534_057720 [Acytostelium subglobosum LB1]GAM22597.1 hypothetical protein SAMD00019534_057720 [Acytostelium subglobosum LB1]|eukprot:XP_012754717.1 hypothetical protein SAMD00019534_057720 [Acytostelium subglobosum LB1]
MINQLNSTHIEFDRDDDPNIITHRHYVKSRTYPNHNKHLNATPAKTTHITYNRKKTVPPGSLRSGLLSLSLGPRFQRPIDKGILPDTLTRLSLDDYKQPLTPGALPSSIRVVNFGEEYNQAIEPGVFDPDSPPEVIQFGMMFNQPLFTEPLGTPVLPTGVIKLTFGYTFDQPLLSGTLPDTLAFLKLGDEFDRALRPGDLPQSLRFLMFGRCFNQHIGPNILPSNLLTLHMGQRFGKPVLPGYLPSTLKEFKNYAYFWDDEEDGHVDVPPLVPGCLPEGLASLMVKTHQPLQLGLLPNSMSIVQLIGNFNSKIEIGMLPLSLTTLSLGDEFRQPLEPGTLPPNLSYLSIGRGFSEPLRAGVLPANLYCLTVHLSLEHVVEPYALPDNLRVFINDGMGMPPVLPDSLSIMYISNVKTIIPPFVKSLVINSNSLEIPTIPPSVESVYFISRQGPGVLSMTFLPQSVTSLGFQEFTDQYRYIPSRITKLSIPLHKSFSFKLLPKGLRHLILKTTQGVYDIFFFETLEQMQEQKKLKKRSNKNKAINNSILLLHNDRLEGGFTNVKVLKKHLQSIVI